MNILPRRSCQCPNKKCAGDVLDLVALTSDSLRPILPPVIFQAYLAEALLFKSRSVALSFSVQGRGLVKGDREREDFRGGRLRGRLGSWLPCAVGQL